MKKAIIFDMDGVIFDSEKACFSCWKEISEKHNLKNIENFYQRVIGVNSDSEKRIFFECYGENLPYEQYLSEERALYFKRYSDGKLPIKKGVFEILNFLKEQNFKIALASSNRLSVIERQLKDAKLFSYFDAISSGDSIKNSKPHPEIFLQAANKLEITEEEHKEIFVIEDSYNGIRAAFSAKMKGIMVPDMLPPNEEMQEKAFVILPDLLAVIEWLKTK